MIVKKLGRPCERCGKRFIPTGWKCRICDKCQIKNWGRNEKNFNLIN